MCYNQLERTVSLDKFSQVCDELARALEREEQMQTVLQVQKERLDEQEKRLDTGKELETGDHKSTDPSGKVSHLFVLYVIACIHHTLSPEP